MLTVDYTDIRESLKSGDVVAFSGKGFPSDQIKFVTHSPISHVGVIVQSKLPGGEIMNSIMESTTLNGFKGVSTSRLSERVASYKGGVYILPLDNVKRETGNWNAFLDFMLRQDHKGYDDEPVLRFLLSRLPFIGNRFVSKEDYKRFFCSELVVAGLKVAGIVPNSVNASDVEPVELCNMAIYAKQYYGLLPPSRLTPAEIPGYNSRALCP